MFVDQHGKVTVSLGGRCPLSCRHCYTVTTQFVHPPTRTAADIVAGLSVLPEGTFNVICVSGDTDCFIDAELGTDLLSVLCESFPRVAIMFTTRLVPPPHCVNRLGYLAKQCSRREQLLIPCISVVTFSYPNRIELPDRVPSTPDRMEFLQAMSEAGLPTILAMRPTFPFSVVSSVEVAAIVEHAFRYTTIALGEVLILDQHAQIARRLGVPTSEETDFVTPMTFLNQPSWWRKRMANDEVAYTRAMWQKRSIPYYLRSPTALRLLKANWRFNVHRLDATDWPVEDTGEYLFP